MLITKHTIQLLLFALMLPGLSMPVSAKCIALLIGVGNYQDPTIRRLQFVNEDLRRTEAGFTRLGYQVITMSSSLKPNDSNFADRDRILAKLEIVTEQCQPGDTFVFYYSGHGFYLDDEKAAYLACYNVSVQGSLLPETGIPVSWIEKTLMKSRASQIVLIMDACQTDPGKGAEDDLNPGLVSQFQSLSKDLEVRQNVGESHPAVVTFFSCSPGESSYADPENKSKVSAFTRFLTDELTQVADRSYATFADVAESVQEDMAQWSSRVNLQQRPDYEQQGPKVYLSGSSKLGLEPAVKEQIEALRKQAEQGDPMAMVTLAIQLETNSQSEGDTAEAKSWYERGLPQLRKKATDHKDLDAQRTLGICYENGYGVPKDYAQAVDWFTKVADQKDIYAQYALGNSYYYGHGVTQDYAQAVAWYQKAADQKDADAQCALGICYGNGYGVKQDYTLAVNWYTMAAGQGNAPAQYNLGVCYENGHGVKQDYAQAVAWYQKAADQKDADAQCALGNCYENGDGVKQDYAQAGAWYQKAADQENAASQANLGDCYYNGHGVPQDDTQAVEWFQKAADQKNEYAQYRLGLCYENGYGVPKDYAQAVDWYTKAADQKDADAQCALGTCYYNGHGVPQDYTQAVEWFQKAADQKEEAAQYDLGICYENGYGVKQDYSQAIAWYHKSADQEDADAQCALGNCYYNNRGVKQDYAQAVTWYQKAADQNDAAAQYALGICYEYGRGFAQDYSQAVLWYKKAADQKYQPAMDALKNLENRGRF